MNQWFAHKCAIPRWFILIVAVLSIVSFIATYMRTSALKLENDFLEGQMAESECILEYLEVSELNMELFFSCGSHGLLPPRYTAFKFVEMQIELLYTLGIVIASSWIIIRNRRTLSEQ
jgi:hypothetical protein